MNRRSFLRVAHSGAFLATSPLWLREAMAAATSDGAEAWESASRRAAALGKPLLAIVIPDGTSDVGVTMGELLNHGPDEFFEDLALCELVCAPVALLRARFPSLGAATPLLLLVENPGDAKTSVRTIAPELEPATDRWGRSDDAGSSKGDWVRSDRAPRERPVDRRIRIVAEAIHRAVVPDGAALRARARAVANHVPRAELKTLRDGAVAGSITDEDAWRIAAALALDAESLSAVRAETVRVALRRASRTRFVRGRLPGSKWARSSGCGTYVERLPDDPPEQGESFGACGMGHVPEKSARFLMFYAQADSRK